MAIKKGAVVVDAKMDYQKIKKDFQNLEKDTSKLIDKYNKSVDSIKSQELAISKVKAKLDELTSGNKTPTSINNLEKSLKKAEKEVANLEHQYQEMINAIEQKQIDLEFAQNLGNTNEVGTIQIEQAQLDSQSIELATQLENARDKAEQLRLSLKQAKLNPDSSIEAQQLSQQLENANSKLEETKERANELKDEIKESLNSKHVSNFGSGIDEVGKKIDKFKSRVTGLMLTSFVFNSLRTGLTSLRNGFVSLLNKNNEFSSSLNQIKANLMTAFAPIYNACLPAINSLMNALSKITGTIAVFTAGLFGTSLKDAKKQAQGLSKSLESTSGALKDTSKAGDEASGSLASFDHLEVIGSENASGGSSGSSGSGGSGDTGIDYSGEIQYSEKLLEILNKIKTFVVDCYNWGVKHKALLIALTGLAVGLFAAFKIANFISSLASLSTPLKAISSLFVKVGEDGTKSFNNVGTGITVAIAGFILMAKNITDLVSNWDDLDTKQKLIKIGMAALGVAAIALGYAIAAGISAATLGIGAIIALIATLLTAIVAITVKLATEEDAILSTKDAQEQLNQAQEDYVNANESYIDAVDNANTKLAELQQAEAETGLSGEELYKSVEGGVLDYANMTDAQKKVYKAYLSNKTAQEELTDATDTLSEAKKAETDASFANQLAIAAEKGNYDEYKQSVLDAYNKGELSAEEARDKIEQAMSRMSDSSQKTFMEDLPDDVKKGMDPDKYQTHGQKFKNWFQTNVIEGLGSAFSKFFTETLPNKLTEFGEKIKTFFTKTFPNTVIAGIEVLLNTALASFEGVLNKPINAINKIIKTANKIPGVNISKFSNVSLGRVNLPRLATGTVIPPRHEFAAILGDQKHGTNIEAPLETIKQANREVLQEFIGALTGLNNNDREIVFKNLTIVAQFGNKDFKKIVVEAVRMAEKELGKPLFVS